ncbi:MAG: MBL fold metallo-hydrolase [Puniceicoccaceae bacterium]
MLPSFHILASSSSGNAALLDTGEEKVLVDCGLSGKRISELSKACGAGIDEIKAVFITHEHQDHAGGLPGLQKHPHLEIISSQGTAHLLRQKAEKFSRWSTFASGARLRLGTLEVETHRIPHDAIDPVAYTFQWGGSSLFSPPCKLGWVLDLGYFPSTLAASLATCDVLVIEANHDEQMLEQNPNRPWSLKQRVRGRHGHLSNRETLEALLAVASPAWKHLCLVHLSRDCNHPSVVQDTFAPLLNSIPGLRLQIVDPQNKDPLPIPVGH